jgi:hypothetical protein
VPSAAPDSTVRAIVRRLTSRRIRRSVPVELQMSTPRTCQGHQTSPGDHIIDGSCSNATTAVPDDSQAGSMVSAMRATFDKALNKDGYKDNAFRGLINIGRPPLDPLNILPVSNLVTKEEKNKAFRPWKSAPL